MTGLDKRKPKPPVVMAGMHAGTAVPVSAALAPVQTVGQAALVSVAAIAWVHVAKAAISVKTVDRVWPMRRFAPNAKPWSVRKCRCANWPHKPMVKR